MTSGDDLEFENQAILDASARFDFTASDQQYPIALTIAGSDSGGGAGLQADMKTMEAHQVFSTTVVVGLTAQNTLGVDAAMPASVEMIDAQFASLMADFDVRAAKTGALFDAETVRAVARNVRQHKVDHLVVDPVMVAKGGAALLDEAGVQTLKEELLPLSELVTPNIPEAELLSGMTIDNLDDMKHAAAKIQALGIKNVMVKGGHLDGDTVVDYIALGDEDFVLTGPKVQGKRKHGTGDTLSAAITSQLAKGMSLKNAILMAHRYMNQIIGQPLYIGHGHGPLNHGEWTDPNIFRKELRADAWSCQFVVGLANVGGSEQALFETVRNACAAGITLVQYREKGGAEKTFEERLRIAKKLTSICRAYQVLFFIDDDVDLAIAVNADGVHVGQSDSNVADIAKQAPQLLVGLSVSNLAEEQENRKVQQYLSYIGVGPVFATTTKKDAKTPIGLKGLAAVKQASKLPVVAIGGVTEKNVKAIRAAGADGLAAISAFTKSQNLEKTVAQFTGKDVKNHEK
ncbi:bifunctional hydroxymethylpyrimidine kinase/phosphomethylpyrimidine kinase [Fructobacillus sp. CRL 2054]|uniref:bifunctional hydroxymethylpyrimidine kinase/phosphomethylpyrimidine kinase n=1 Tax=Fructobacillus sp. CRL 2054 TaxID=2763007 RepID=UPI0023837741|nr:bifunctional hydroxymethylpyrimidine kinase/phosphomethylpyrimidine kinase [Fructobacillus sp. CRL 2054]